MIYACPCGAKKSAQPHRSAGVKPWKCPKCSGERTFRSDPVPDDVYSKVTASKKRSLLERIKAKSVA